MDLKECYKDLCGDFDAIIKRLSSEQIIKKFIFRFLEDKSFLLLCESMSNQNTDEAFRAAHTLKGICQNLSFTLLHNSCDQITEALRCGSFDEAKRLLPGVKEDYEKTVSAITRLKESS